MVEPNVRFIVGGCGVESKNEFFVVVAVIDSFNSVMFKVSCSFVTIHSQKSSGVLQIKAMRRNVMLSANVCRQINEIISPEVCVCAPNDDDDNTNSVNCMLMPLCIVTTLDSDCNLYMI